MEQRFRNSENSEWGDYPAQTMCEETQYYPIELLDGKKRTLGDLYDQTPKEFISKVMLEEKVFTTWHYRRYVLLGDGKYCLSSFQYLHALFFCYFLLFRLMITYKILTVACHKLNPSGGHGTSTSQCMLFDETNK